MQPVDSVLAVAIEDADAGCSVVLNSVQALAFVSSAAFSAVEIGVEAVAEPATAVDAVEISQPVPAGTNPAHAVVVAAAGNIVRNSVVGC